MDLQDGDDCPKGRPSYLVFIFCSKWTKKLSNQNDFGYLSTNVLDVFSYLFASTSNFSLLVNYLVIVGILANKMLVAFIFVNFSDFKV